ncbi:MAG: hypothetical protein Q8M86_10235 [Syntrophales bacterium]|nr:hypothetical protein [Syntrophales bacterium]
MRTNKLLNIVELLILSGLMLYCFRVTDAFCEDWILFAKFGEGNLIYYDRHSIEENSKNSVKVWTKLEYSKKGLEEDRKFMMEEQISEAEMKRRGHDRLHHSTVLWEMQCQDNISCMSSFTDYDSSGKILFSDNVPANESCDSITPEAPEIRSLFKMLCSKQKAMK